MDFNENSSNMEETSTESKTVPETIPDTISESVPQPEINEIYIEQPYMSAESTVVKKRVHAAAIVIAACSAIIFILGVVGALSWFMFRPDIKMLFMSSNTYLEQIEKSNFSFAADSLNNIGASRSAQPEKYKSSTVLTAELKSKDENPVIEPYKQFINNSKIEINVEEDKKAMLSSSEIKLSLNNEMINCSLESILNQDKSAVRIPQANDNYILLDSNASYRDINSLLKDLTGKDIAAIRSLIEGYYKDAFIASLSKSGTTFNTNDKYEHLSLNSLTTEIDKVTAKKILDCFASKIEKDKELLEIIYHAINKNQSLPAFSAGNEAKTSKSDVEDAIKSFAEMIKDSAANMNEFDTLVLKIYFDNSERIIAREISNKDMKLILHCYNSNNKNHVKCTLTDLKNSADLFNIEMNGQFTKIGFDGDLLMEIKEAPANSVFKLDWTGNISEGGSGDIRMKFNAGSNQPVTVTLTYLITKAAESYPIPVGSYTVRIQGPGNFDYSVLFEVKEIKKNSGYETSVRLNDVSKILGAGFEGVSLELKAETTIGKTDKVNVPDIDSLKTIKLEDVKPDEYFGPLLEMFGLDSSVLQAMLPQGSFAAA